MSAPVNTCHFCGFFRRSWTDKHTGSSTTHGRTCRPGGHFLFFCEVKQNIAADNRTQGVMGKSQQELKREFVQQHCVLEVEFPSRELGGGKIQAEDKESLKKQHFKNYSKAYGLYASYAHFTCKHGRTDPNMDVDAMRREFSALKEEVNKMRGDSVEGIKEEFIQLASRPPPGPKAAETTCRAHVRVHVPTIIVNGDFETAGKAMAMSTVHLGPTTSCLHPAIVSALCGENLPDMSGFRPLDQEAAAFVAKLESATEVSLKDLLESDVGLNITTMAGWQKPAGSTILAEVPILRRALCLQDLVRVGDVESRDGDVEDRDGDVEDRDGDVEARDGDVEVRDGDVEARDGEATVPLPSPRPNVRSGRPNIDASGAWTPSQKPGMPDRPSQPVHGPSGEGLGALHKP
ncbi:hypothetical protein Bbelb_291710 [Branchiostoma belcheri]|nr:hypothetical protein Bbelb_291710 [Branchiostoma belcheri]